jgi:glutathione synthase/RimK-type ligase-like ATP-grasp enzyme
MGEGKRAPRIAVATSANAAELTSDEPILQEALRRSGARPSLLLWDGDTDWSRFDAVVLRSTWDYWERLPEFLAWIDRVSRVSWLVNPAELVRWNIDKRYLLELAQRGVAIVPTEIAETSEVPAAIARVPGDAIIKPVVSAGGHGLQVVAAGAPAPAVDPRQGPWMVQPLVESIRDRGEVSVIAIDGEVSHAIRKRAAAGSVLIHREHGGRYERVEPSAAEIAIAEEVLSICGRQLYARVDLVEHDGAPHVMEVELIEPELFFQMVPEAADRFARALRRRLR